jgi:hypothetical protein
LLKEALQRGGFLAMEDLSFYSEQVQTPLSVALGISPLFLLGNRMLASICMGKLKIVEASGKAKPLHGSLLTSFAVLGKPR